MSLSKLNILHFKAFAAPQRSTLITRPLYDIQISVASCSVRRNNFRMIFCCRRAADSSIVLIQLTSSFCRKSAIGPSEIRITQSPFLCSIKFVLSIKPVILIACLKLTGRFSVRYGLAPGGVQRKPDENPPK
ncbi:hypothetical protein BMETH_169_0 [methanotrophic bacterial endosymbiont of Bathymodiolus sp.]|nr:hypothetical protein BMETH_169_0 [methanotrophic bacterial endosymbiont of Bathymodiolus sp.]